jgi:hypothetical protein
MDDVGLSNHGVYHGEDTMDELATVKVPIVGKYKGTHTLVDARDLARVSQYNWGKRVHYVCSADVGTTLHQFIMGPRPAHIPDDYVIDHKLRDMLDNRRSMLRWVSISFNAWNREIKGSSVYKGVSLNKKTGKWVAFFKGTNLGSFDNERDAGRMVARAALAEYEWAADCDLISRHFSNDEIQEMINEGRPEKLVRALPKGVSYHTKSKKYVAQHKHQGKYTYIGLYTTVSEAKAAYDNHVAIVKNKEWNDHLQTDITYDADGHAVIELSGKKGRGLWTQVPTQLWHVLTFKTKVHLVDNKYAYGRWKSKAMALHNIIWKLLHPHHVKKKGYSIDHRDPSATLNNLESNLRYVCQGDQDRNKQKRGKGMYPGVAFATRLQMWKGQLRVNGVLHRTPYMKCEHACARALNEIRLRVLGKDAMLNTIQSDCSDCHHCNNPAEPKKPSNPFNYKWIIPANDKWRGCIMAKGVIHSISCGPCIHDVARKTNSLRLEKLGPTAALNKIMSDCSDCPHCNKC